MNSENITIENVLEIFSDYLENSEIFEVVETKKMGYLTVLDASEKKDRSMLSIEKVEDADTLIQQLLWFEISDCFYAVNKQTADPWKSDETTQNYVMNCMLPRLNNLPEEYKGILYEYFSDPNEM